MLTKALIVARQALPGALRALVASLAILPASAHGIAPDALIRRITAEEVRAQGIDGLIGLLSRKNG